MRDSQGDRRRRRVARDSSHLSGLHHHTVQPPVAHGNVPHVQAMTTGEQKWFAATTAELTDYLQQRIALYGTAKLIQACPDCATG